MEIEKKIMNLTEENYKKFYLLKGRIHSKIKTIKLKMQRIESLSIDKLLILQNER